MSVAEISETGSTRALWPDGAAYIDGEFVPISEAKISVLDWGFTKSDVTYDVAHVWKGSFFRLDDHIRRFNASIAGLRMTLPFDDAGLAEVLTECVRRTGLRDAYVAMVLTRGMLKPGMARKPENCVNTFIAYAIPFAWVMPPEMQERGAHVIVSTVPRIPPESVDPTIKNYHWGDLVRALFEAADQGADNAVLLDGEGYVTEGPGFNVFAVIDGTVVSPDRGAFEGVTRLSVLDLCDELGIPKRIGRLTADELRDADEVIAATTAGGVMPVSRVDDRILSNGRPGPISLKLKERYWAAHDEGWHATPIDYD